MRETLPQRLLSAFECEQVNEGASLPRLSVIIPTLNSSQPLAWTLPTINAQTYDNIEVIIVDAGSVDRTLEVVQRGCERPFHVYSVAEHGGTEMYNRGISLASGEYVTILHPGDTYLSQEVVEHMAKFAANRDRPDLLYFGCLISEAAAEPQVLLDELSLERLRMGQQPTSLPGCWFRVDTLKRLGKFDSSYRVRGGFDLFCRFLLHGDLRVAQLPRVFVDHDRGHRSPKDLFIQAWETGEIIRKRFGRRAAFGWWLGQNQLRFLRWWWKSRGMA